VEPVLSQSILFGKLGVHWIGIDMGWYRAMKGSVEPGNGFRAGKLLEASTYQFQCCGVVPVKLSGMGIEI
jgi:hypothetical protein